MRCSFLFDRFYFNQVRSFISCKSLMEGVETFPETSRTCPECGSVNKKNRKTQGQFFRIVCGHEALPDHVAARNIAKIAANRPGFSTRLNAGQGKAPASAMRLFTTPPKKFPDPCIAPALFSRKRLLRDKSLPYRKRSRSQRRFAATAAR